MRTTGVWLVLALGCAGFAVAAGSRGASRQHVPPGIEALHRGDVAATLSQDPDALAALWTGDGVLLGEGERPVVGRAALRAAYAQGGWKVLRYAPRVLDVVVDGDSAVEWGRFEVTMVTKDQPQPTELRGRFLRSMRKQPDGAWKFARIMWQPDPR
ncbi:nuclear transport factor 2 family protein [Fulvimonas sp. R45]|uniref:YybH family protein n=1 Tax=Fulvimonas sp. R45 TaxID=3045937 RepID=UPI00265E9924|nr:nuclear transport factor 2 family protein [Fulvimonas sp. R45]MDO1527591.1 nuclear transport factor 2 family protein [Fulvimonas sp. R45]